MAQREILEETDGQQLGVEWLKERAMSMALAALSSRSLVWVAALGAGAMWTFTVLHPDWLKITASVGYCLSVFAPILIRDAKGAG
jgi:hypothetical protein